MHIFKNSNRNNKGYVLVFFRNHQEIAQAQKYAIKYYNTKLFWETSEVVSNEIYDIEEEYKQRYYTHDTGKKAHTKPEKRNKVYSEEEKEEIYKENKHKEPFVHMARCIQALEKKLSSFENN